MVRLKFNFFILIFLIFTGETKSAVFLTADVDLRYEDELKVDGAGVTLRKVFTDKLGDRIILFTLIDSMDNFKEMMLDQAYLQYKGPLGKWNITLGRYILPYGLLLNYSTKRLIIKTLEYETIGIESDNGVLISGSIKNFDYALSLSQGVGEKRWADVNDEGLVVFRIGYQGVDFEDFRVGLSCALGNVLSKKMHTVMTDSILYKRLLAVDLIKYFGAGVLRTELSFGEEEKKTLLGVFSGVDYAILPKLDINLGYSYLDKRHYKTDAINVGATYNLDGFQIRIAQKLSLTGGEQNEFSLQVYRIFSYTF